MRKIIQLILSFDGNEYYALSDDGLVFAESDREEKKGVWVKQIGFDLPQDNFKETIDEP